VKDAVKKYPHIHLVVKSSFLVGKPKLDFILNMLVIICKSINQMPERDLLHFVSVDSSNKTKNTLELNVLRQGAFPY
jgi:hypothetical protein